MRRRIVTELVKAFPHAEISMRMWQGVYNIKLQFGHSFCIFTPEKDLLDSPYTQEKMDEIISIITNLPNHVAPQSIYDDEDEGGGFSV